LYRFTAKKGNGTVKRVTEKSNGKTATGKMCNRKYGYRKYGNEKWEIGGHGQHKVNVRKKRQRKNVENGVA